MNIFILDKNLKIIDKFMRRGDIQKMSPFFNDIYKQYLETGAETFTFTCLKNKNIEYGNYVVFIFDNKCKLFQISDINETHSQNFEVEVYCEFAGLELTDEPLRARTIASANIKQYLENVLGDVDWQVGYIDEDITDIYTIEIKKATKVYSHIQETIKKYDCEIEFRVELKGNRVVGKYIDAYKKRGIETNVRIEYGKLADKITRRTTGKPLSTALIGYGKNDIDFKNVEWSKANGDPCDKPLGQDWVGDDVAYRKYNRNGNHLMGIYESDSESQAELLRFTYRELQNVKEPQVDYACNVAIFDYSKIRLGDTVYVIDNEFGSDVLHLSARVNTLEISFTDESKNKVEFSNYKKVKSKITSEMRSIINQIPSNTEFMGISKGGLLSSNIEADGFDIQVKNKLVDENGKEYYFSIKDKKETTFMSDILTYDSRWVSQSFAIDFEEECIYVTQSVTEVDPSYILLSKIKFNGTVVGHMKLHGFGHGSQIGIDKINGITKIWCECHGEPHITTGKLFGTKICRFNFEDGREYTTSAGNVFDMVQDARNMQVAVSEETNRLSIKYITYSNRNAINVYDLKSVIDNNPRLLASFTIPSWLETSISPSQGHSVYGNRIYHYEGGDSSVANGNNTRITVLDFLGNVVETNLVEAGINLANREAEGLYVRENDGIYELYAGFSSGPWPNRKYQIYKYTDGLSEGYEKRGSFIHNNGYRTSIHEDMINTYFDGSDRRKAYLLFTDKVNSNFIVAKYKSGKWWYNDDVYNPGINDAIIAELVETNDRVDITLLTNDFESIKGDDGQDGVPGRDAIFLELTNEFHSVPTDMSGNNGVYSGCETELKLYKGDVLLTDNISYTIKNTSKVVGRLEGNRYTVTNLTADTGYVDLVATYLGQEYIKRFSISKNKQGLGGEDGLTPTVYWLMASTSTISKDTSGNLKPSSVTFWSKSQTGESSVTNYQGIFKIYESTDGNIFTLKYTSELDDTVPYTPSSTAQSIKCELYLNDGSTLIDQDIINIVKDGTDGFSGSDAKYVLLTGDQLFKYSNNFTGTPTPSSITLTGTPYNISTNNAKWYYKKANDSDYTLIPSNNGNMEFTINHNDSTLFSNNNRVVTIKFDIDGYYDEMTIAKISDGGNGSEGEDGYFVLLTNENHTVPCENNGDVVDGELEKAKTEIHVYKGTQEVSFSMSKTDAGCTSTYNSSTKTLSITSLTSKSATVTMKITVNGTVFTKIMTISKATKGDTGEDAYTVSMTNDNYSFNSNSNGNIASAITTTTVITAFKGINPVVPTIGTLPSVTGLTLSKSNGIITIKANTGTSLAENGSFNIPVTVDGNSFTKVFSWTKVKNGANGSNGVSITSVDVEYAISSSSTTAPTSGWQTTAPAWQNGKYIWSRTKTTYSSGNPTYSTAVCITGGKGETGSTGQGITSITEEYYLSTSKTTQTGGSWVTTPPTWSVGKYMWTRSKIVYSNPTKTEYTTPICDSSWEAINDIEIGIRNLHKYTDFSKTNVLNKWYRYTATNNTLSISTYVNFGNNLSSDAHIKNQKALRSRINIDQAIADGVDYGGFNIITSERTIILESNTEYTFSCWFYRSGNCNSCHATIWEDIPTGSKSVGKTESVTEYTGSFVRKSVTFRTTDETNYYIRFYHYPNMSKTGSSSDVHIYQPMLTKGNKVLDWTPALEDVDKEISDVASSLEGLETSVKDAFGDGIINDAEAKALASNIQILNNEKSDLDREVSTVYANSNLGGTAKTNLNTANTDYRNCHASLISSINTAIADNIITSAENTSVNSFFNTYRTKLSTLRQRLQEANDYISSNKIDNIQIGATNLQPNSAFNGYDGWGSRGTGWGIDTITKFENVNTMKFTRTGLTANSMSYLYAGNKVIKCNPNETFTISAYFYTQNKTTIDGGGVSFGIWFYASDGSGTGSQKIVPNLINNTWSRFIVTATAPANTAYVALVFGTSRNGVYWVAKPKLEKGNKATDWSPAPEDNESTIVVGISGQQSMKYLDKATAPIPSSVTLTANVNEGSKIVSSNVTYIWQYKNSSGSWVNLSGTYTNKTYSLAHNNSAFVNDIAQIRVAASYKSNTYYDEHTVTKFYDYKYISKQEVFDKITEGGTNQLIYKDPDTGDIYINATYIKTGQFVADLIKGGLLTLGGTGDNSLGDYGRFRILDSSGQNEVASLDGGEMKIVNLQSETLNATEVNVEKINCVTYAPAIYETTKIYVNATSGSDDIEFDNGAIYKTLQVALDSVPKNLNGFTVDITLQTNISEDITIRGYNSGTLNLYMNKKNINGYIVARDCSAQIFILGGLTTSDIADGINNGSLRPNIQPSSLFSFGGYNYSFVAIGCTFVYVRSIDIFGKTGTTTNYCGGAVNGSNVYVQNVNAYASNSGWNVTTGGKMTTKETYGRCERLAYNVQLGGVAHICNGNSTGAPSNIYTGNGGQVIQGSVTFIGSGDVGTNTNTTTNNTNTTLTSSYGDSYKVKYSSWRKDNSVRQGDWSGTTMNKGCWFFGNQFTDLKGKTIKSIKLTIKRQSGGNSGAVAFTLKMHNHTGRPSGSPSYLSWSKNISLSVGQSTTITITDSMVLTAIKNGTMKGFGVEVSSTSNSYYGILSPTLKAVVTY